MPRESRDQRRRRFTGILGALKATYPEAHCELNYSNPLELLVATILSAQCTDRLVNQVTEGLFRKYRSAEAYARASLGDLENDLRRIGLFRNKAKSLQACCRRLLEEHGGEVPASMDALTRLAGVGRKTANVVLGNAFGLNEGVVVDTHVARLSGRLGLSREGVPEKIERDLMALAQREDWALLSHLLIWHGRRRCGALSPDCGDCEVRDWCPSADRVRQKRRPPKRRAA